MPLSNDGEKLIESTGNVCAVFNLPNEAAAIAHFVNSRDGIIEQQAAEIDALKAHVERLCNVAIKCHDENIASEEALKALFKALFYAPSSPVKPEKAAEIELWYKKFKEAMRTKDGE